ncbi:capsular polysaccharide biosynthesis protein [uncultured Microbulbifer sp.]|uniref:capsular polysaccharide biosynthesis protein n=1 Tax=uncultured Microbulbifer sp. TaxID=348147 RepID=UPI0026336DD5|nr:capsular polysaccharide biosynthesis protein [uncultured Microbulbifer sp.]
MLFFSYRMFRITHLRKFINSKRYFFQPRPLDIIGWGYTIFSKHARWLSSVLGLRYVALEDGFIRSIGLGVDGFPSFSLVVDDLGIYYDARFESRLERLINESKYLNKQQIQRSVAAMSAISEFQITKYNTEDSSSNSKSMNSGILVVDQTIGDASIEGALADGASFHRMLHQAVIDHPGEIIYVKAHPDVLSGKKRGFLTELAASLPNVKVLTGNPSIWTLAAQLEEVYTVSSLFGFEALMAGVKVKTFGVPFYAGWGLTIDYISILRRSQVRSLEQVFYAAYIQYAYYCAPNNGADIELEEIINFVADRKREASRQELHVNLDNISKWKRGWIRDFLIVWRMKEAKDSGASTVAWGRKNRANLRIEDGFIRSVGLGVHFNRPISLVCDRRSLYFDASTLSDLEASLQYEPCSDWERMRGEYLIKELAAVNLTKYNVGSQRPISFPGSTSIILVPGQVESDGSLEFGAPNINTNAELLTTVRKHNLDAYIIYKPHPDVVAGQRDNGYWRNDALMNADHIELDADMGTLLHSIDEVHTLTSLTGFEALLRGKRVTTYGIPFYSGWGLTTDILHCRRRTRKISLSELVFHSLVKYPTYVCPVSGSAISVEQAIEVVQRQLDARPKAKNLSRILLLAVKFLRTIVRS